jgi:hypothetical protein
MSSVTIQIFTFSNFPNNYSFQFKYEDLMYSETFTFQFGTANMEKEILV